MEGTRTRDAGRQEEARPDRGRQVRRRAVTPATNDRPLTLADYRQGREWRRTCGCAATADVREDAVLKCLCCECGAPLASFREGVVATTDEDAAVLVGARREPASLGARVGLDARAPVGRAVTAPTVVAIRFDGLKLQLANDAFGASRGAFYAKAAKIAKIRDAVRVGIEARLPANHGDPSSVHVVRVAPGTLDDDNLVAAFKRVLDGTALALGIDDKRFEIVIHDKPGGIPVTFAQRKEGKGRYAVEVVLTWGAP